MWQLEASGRVIGPVAAVLIDKDGTLAHSAPYLETLAAARVAACLQAVAAPQRPALRGGLKAAFGLANDGLDPMGSLAVAGRRDNLISAATCLAQAGLSWHVALDAAEAAFARAETDGTGQRQACLSAPVAGARAWLEQARSQELPCAVLSADTTAPIEAFLTRWGLRQLIHAVRGADQLPAKPEAGAVHSLAGSLGVSSGDCVVIGDSAHDIAMGRAAGVRAVIGFTGGWARPPTLPQADLLIAAWQELAINPWQG
ncbi:MAG: HAD family hydrolase [Aphanocapsa feldmannii 277cV]|uniref:HAD family hydrolase n=2 Tax=Aphanocapsa feldmannii TaxID=192050 RepID=A0A524RMN7_9CHRO|nr:MAG: HAD family hydrolase [Aphanocapsa feldmannii 288cV]TGG91900.1 MAG: HAD family hydrolase [Aphanocapsa feldmannii 277cV]TGH20340.1 MAG: HAD family hydrolase [Aphanocapsa feldmannii 277cI]